MYLERAGSLSISTLSAFNRETNSIDSAVSSSESKLVRERSFISRIARACSPVNLSARFETSSTSASFGEAEARITLITRSSLSIALSNPDTISRRHSLESLSALNFLSNTDSLHVFQREITSAVDNSQGFRLSMTNIFAEYLVSRSVYW